MFKTKQNLQKLYNFLGLEYPKKDGWIRDGYENELPIKRYLFEAFKEKVSKDSSDLYDIVNKLDKKLDKMIRFLDIIEEDYIAEDIFGNKSIEKRFVKTKK